MLFNSISPFPTMFSKDFSSKAVKSRDLVVEITLYFRLIHIKIIIFAKDNLNVDEVVIFVFHRVENIV